MDFFLFLVIFFLISACIDFFLKTPRYKGTRSDHFDGKSFYNISLGKRHILTWKDNSVSEMCIFFLKRMDRKIWRRRELSHGETVPVARVLGREIVVTFINHATVLIQTEGLNILTDPVWQTYVSPLPPFGPRRYMSSGVALKNLPPIDIVLLTHNHYDHLDVKTLQTIACRYNPTIFTPLGNSKFLKRKGIIGSIDMDWGETKKFSDLVSVECVPAQHFSARAITDRFKTLWAGFVVRTPHGNIYFAGDTAYGPFVSRIQKMYPEGFRLAFLPIGAYEPKAFMRSVHMSPDEAVQTSVELKVEHSIPIHFGTFDLALDGQDDAVHDLVDTLALTKNKSVKFTVLTNGETCRIE